MDFVESLSLKARNLHQTEFFKIDLQLQDVAERSGIASQRTAFVSFRRSTVAEHHSAGNPYQRRSSPPLKVFLQPARARPFPLHALYRGRQRSHRIRLGHKGSTETRESRELAPAAQCRHG